MQSSQPPNTLHIAYLGHLQWLITFITSVFVCVCVCVYIKYTLTSAQLPFVNCLTLEMSVTIYITTHPNALEELNFKYHSAMEPEHVEAEYASCSISLCTG
jgi:hypothetical protein